MFFVYITAPNGTVHLMPDDFANVTLCGRTPVADWEYGDETLSGLVATCRTCSRIAKQRSQTT